MLDAEKFNSYFDDINLLVLPSPTLPPAEDTNTVFLGKEHFWVIEPAAHHLEDQARLCALIKDRISLGHRLHGIVLTHHHIDHVAALTHVLHTFDVPYFCHPKTQEKLGGPTSPFCTRYRPITEHTVPPHFTWQIIHTPGHAPGHLCIWDPKQAVLIAGDMVAGTGTVLIDPHDGGNMGEYLSSLQRLDALPCNHVIPAHGPVQDHGIFMRTHTHRLARETKVYGQLNPVPQFLQIIASKAYMEAPTLSAWLKERSTLAHLMHLQSQEKATCTHGLWHTPP